MEIEEMSKEMTTIKLKSMQQGQMKQSMRGSMHADKDAWNMGNSGVGRL